jgi:hypothetical protein
MASQKQKEITSALNQFYQRPVALVSLELLLSIGLVLFLGIFAIQPTLMTMSDLIKEREDKIKLSEQLEKKTAALQTAQIVYTQIQSQLPYLDEAIPQQPELVKSLKILEKLATENNVIVSNISVPEIPDEKAAIDSKVPVARVDLPVSVSISGDYLAIRAYVEALQNSRRSFVIDTVGFALQENRGQKKLSANITVAVPYLGVPIK